MSHYNSYLNSAVQIIGEYTNKEPFSLFLKGFFKRDKKYGSKDRKEIRSLCYGYFRVRRATEGYSIKDAIVAGSFICSKLAEGIPLELENPIPLPNEIGEFKITDVFPWKEVLSEGINFEKFCESFFIQPDLFIRIRPHQEEAVLSKLDSAGIKYEFIPPFTLRLPNSFKVEQYFEIDKEVVIQDYSSQQVAEYIPVNSAEKTKVWDCCAASGGKSLLAYDINNNITLTVSDVRTNIIANLKKRFNVAGIKNYKAIIADLGGKSVANIGNYNLIIADVPCSGSGTWGRTPEQLSSFKEEDIVKYSKLQKQILKNIIPHVLPGGYLLFITCSVFKNENEENAEFIKNQKLGLVKSALLKGYDKKADTMFVALFKKPL